MLTWIIVILIVLWALGALVLSAKIIHLLLIVAGILLLLKVIKGR